MNKAEPDTPRGKADKVSFADAQTLPPRASLLPDWLMSAAGVVMILAALAGAWWQEARPLPQTPAQAFAPSDFDWWRYPIESNPALRLPAIQGNLRGVHALADGKVWVVGEGGLILHSPDAGLTWRQQHPAPARTPSEPADTQPKAALPGLIGSAHAMDPRQQSLAPPDQNIQQNIAPTVLPDPKRIEPIRIPPQTKTTPATPLPVKPTIKPTTSPAAKPVVKAPTRAIPKPALKPARNPTLKPATQPVRPKPESIEPPPDDADLYSVFFQDAKNGWAAGDQGKVWRTRDGGASWQAEFVGMRVRLVHLYFDGGLVFAVSTDRRIFSSDLGANNWRATFSDVPMRPVEKILATGPAGLWQAGENGALQTSPDKGTTWQTRPSGTQATLHGVAFADARRGWVVGDAGTLLHSDDAGQTWRAQSGGETSLAARRTGEQNRRFPAPWTWLLLMLGETRLAIGANRLRLAAAAAPADTTAGIAGLFVSDQPLKPGDADHLGHGRIARGLADFIRNRNTEPGLTLAVTGSWGSGKSSIMRLLEDDLKRAGFRPAWFNAWHHQQEGRQLASMFNTIRAQAVPPIHTPAAWRVRAALYWNRGWFYRLLALGVLALFLLGFLEAHDRQAPLTQLRQAVIGALIDTRPVVITSASLENLRKGGIVHAETLQLLTSTMTWQGREMAGEGCLEIHSDCSFSSIEQLYASLKQEKQRAALSDAEKLKAAVTDEEKQALAEAVQHLGNTPGTMLGMLLGALVVPLLLGKGLAVYGLNYLDLFKRLLPERGKIEGKEAVGTMENFRNQFCNLTQALDGRLVLFIDDLDRCDCATVREVLELVNYLVSVGQCFVVLGMAMEHVACCIEPKTPKQETDGYAMQYLKKLVNIEVPVPKADLDAIRAMLEGQAQASERPIDHTPARRQAAWAFSLLVLAALTFGMQQTWKSWQPEASAKKFFLASTPDQPSIEVSGAVAAKPAPASEAPRAKKPRSPGQIGLMPMPNPANSAWTTWLSLCALAALIGGAGWATREKWLDWLHRHGILQAIRIQLGGAARKRDTPAFRAALESWHAVIVTGDPTPRGIKRFVNRVRFLAMMEQALDNDQIPEGVLVGLAALHHARVDLSEDIEHLSDRAYWAATIDEHEAEQSDKQQERGVHHAIQAAMRNTPDWPPKPQHVERFLHMVEFMHVR